MIATDPADTPLAPAAEVPGADSGTGSAAGAAARHTRALAAFTAAVGQIRPDQLTLPTPCADWNVRNLLDHVVGEARWAAELVGGATIAEVGDRLAGDLLGSDPAAAWAEARDAALDALARVPDIGTATVELSFGVTPLIEYLHQLTADYLVHAWDLATAIGADDRFDPELADDVLAWFVGVAGDYRSAGAVAAPVASSVTDDPQVRLLTAFGRDPNIAATAAAVARFDAAFDRKDVDAVMAAMTSDCVFESTTPPDGARSVGQAAVRAAWTAFFQQSATARFTAEEQITWPDRVVVRWRYEWDGGHVRGVDLFRVRDGLVAEKLSYVKG